jgi:uncharacterized membrane protein YdjX (TVP38/TMEM64 family)
MPRKRPSLFASSRPAAKSAPPGGSRHGAHYKLLFGLAEHKKKLWWVAAYALLLIVAVTLVWRYTDVSWSSIIDWIDGLNPWLVLPLMAVLPIGGFPISVVYLFAGARFGPFWGGVVVAAVTTAHLLGTYLIARSFLRAPLQRFIERRNAHLPEIPVDEHAAICVIAALVPGLPYVVRNYLLALSGVKLSYYIGVCVPIYVARSYVTILLGDMGSEPSRTKIVILLAVDVVKVAVCALVIWRLREHHRKYHGHHDDDHPGGAIVPPSAAMK